MSSTTARPSYPDKRANGGATPDSARPLHAGHESFRSDFSDPRYREASPQPSYAGTSHKRTASGNPRPASRTAEERRTEHIKVTTRETLVTRTKSPDRRNGQPPKERARAPESGTKTRPVETRTREPKVEAPPGESLDPCRHHESLAANDK